MHSTLTTLNITTEVPLSKAPNPKLLSGRRNVNGCPLRVCVHLDGLNAEHKFRVCVSPYLTVTVHTECL